jgi:hypothetical protein
MSAFPTLERARGIRLLKAALLVELMRHPAGQMTANEVDDFWIALDNELIPERDRELAISSLVEEGFIIPPSGSLTFFEIDHYDNYSLTNSGLTEIQISSRNKKSAIYQLRTQGERWLRQEIEDVYSVILDSTLAPLPGQPSSVIDFSIHSKQQHELLKKLDELIGAIKSSNTFQRGDPATHAQVSDSLEQLGKEIKKGKTTIGRIEAIGFGTLSFVVTKFADTFIGALATDLWSAITRVVHLFL